MKTWLGINLIYKEHKDFEYWCGCKDPKSLLNYNVIIYHYFDYDAWKAIIEDNGNIISSTGLLDTEDKAKEEAIKGLKRKYELLGEIINNG